MPLRELILEIAQLWPAYHAGRKVAKADRTYTLVAEELPAALKALVPEAGHLLFEALRAGATSRQRRGLPPSTRA